MNEWGWTKYRRTGWINSEGLNVYEAWFVRFRPVGDTETCHIVFPSSCPKKTLSKICTSRQHPRTFNDMTLD